eukprot:4905268-Amphidinium_carterae.1
MQRCSGSFARSAGLRRASFPSSPHQDCHSDRVTVPCTIKTKNTPETVNPGIANALSWQRALGKAREH